jgi:hypothetical protein
MDKILTLFGAETTLTSTFEQPTDPLECGALGGKWEPPVPPAAKGVCTGAKEAKGLFGDDGVVTGVINWLLYIVGIASVIMIIVGGIRYASSAGNEKAVTGAKNTIIYAVIGLAASLLAWVIVNFVITAV